MFVEMEKRDVGRWVLPFLRHLAECLMYPSFSKTAYKCLFNKQKIVYRTKFRDYYPTCSIARTSGPSAAVYTSLSRSNVTGHAGS
jgi:hypothetical protein